MNEIIIDPFECFEVDNTNKVLKTPYGNVPYIYTNNGQPAFRGINITDILGYENGRQAIRLHVHPDYIISTNDENLGNNEGLNNRLENRQLLNYILEPGLYALLMSSKKTHAIDFQKWLFETGLPSICPPEKKNEEGKEHDIIMYNKKITVLV